MRSYSLAYRIPVEKVDPTEAWTYYHELLTDEQFASLPTFKPPTDSPFASGDEWADELESKVWATHDPEELRRILEAEVASFQE